MRTKRLLSLAIAAIFAQGAFAAVIFDQIGPAPGTNMYGWVSQDFETALDAYDSICIDEFALTQTYRLDSIEAVTTGWGLSFSYASVQNWRVEIFNTSAQAASSLVGPVAHLTGLAGTVNPLGALTAIVDFDITSQGVVLSPGTYWIGVMARLDFATGGQLGILTNNYAGNNLSYVANPGGGFGVPGNLDLKAGNFQYRLEGTLIPEPGQYGIMAALGLLGFFILRRQALRNRPRR